MYDPGKSPESDVLACINEIPRAYFRIAAAADRLHADLGVTGAARGVMRDLFLDGERTAPDLARTKPVTRQAIQPVLDDLVARGFALALENPRHRRSKVYRLTQKGIDICVEVQRRELDALREHLPAFAGADFAGAADALRRIADVMQQKLEAADASGPLQTAG